MVEFNHRTDSVDVMQIMERIRDRIREQRGPDDIEPRVQELAQVTLDRCLEPRRAGSELVEHNRRLTPPGRFDRDPQGRSLAPEPFEFDEDTLYVSSRGTMGKLIRLIRKLLNPILRLFINPDPIIFAMMRQAEINSRLLDLLDRVNAEFERTGKKFAAREELDALNYEVVNNLVVEMSRLAVDMKNHKMLVESVAGRLDFDERRAQALESVRQARSTPPGGVDEGADGEGTAAGPTRTRRRRRRSRRRAGGAPNAAAETAGEMTSPGDASPGETAPGDASMGDAPTSDGSTGGASTGDPSPSGGAEGGDPSEPPSEPTERAAAPDRDPTREDVSAPAESDSPAAPAALPEAGDASPPPPAEQTRPAEPPDDAGER